LSIRENPIYHGRRFLLWDLRLRDDDNQVEHRVDGAYMEPGYGLHERLSGMQALLCTYHGRAPKGYGGARI
jgi:hypothetical protein